jgi:hypothetical protein
MPKIIDYTGKTFGKLTVIKKDTTRKSKSGSFWLCKCECGNETSVLTQNLKSGKTSSCGCGKADDLTGKTFGEWTVLERDTSKKGVHWKCKCSCGVERTVSASNLRTGNSTSCGHILANELREKKTKHGMSYTRFYYIWQDMLKRCYDANNKQYHNYGARGITVCDSWREDFINFKDDMYDSYLESCNIHGEKDTTIDRIDVNQKYCKENCKWSTKEEQLNNRRITLKGIVDGEEMTLSDISKKYNIPYQTLLRRNKEGRKLL